MLQYSNVDLFKLIIYFMELLILFSFTVYITHFWRKIKDIMKYLQMFLVAFQLSIGWYNVFRVCGLKQENTLETTPKTACTVMLCL